MCSTNGNLLMELLPWAIQQPLLGAFHFSLLLSTKVILHFNQRFQPPDINLITFSYFPHSFTWLLVLWIFHESVSEFMAQDTFSVINLHFNARIKLIVGNDCLFKGLKSILLHVQYWNFVLCCLQLWHSEIILHNFVLV